SPIQCRTAQNPTGQDPTGQNPTGQSQRARPGANHGRVPMMLRGMRMTIGFVLACLGAGITLAAFDIALDGAGSLPPGRFGAEVGLTALAAALQSAIFAAPLALAGAVIGEWRRIAGYGYYLLIAVAIAAAGVYAQYAREQTGEPSIVNAYALSAFLMTGLVAGAIYWFCAGRF